MAKPATTVSMKLLIDTKMKRVLFAEAGKDCVDFLFQILSLPVATVIRLLQGQEMVGSWPNLYQSIQDLSYPYIERGKNKDTFLKPAAPVSSSSVPLLGLNDAPPEPTIRKNFYRCSGTYCQSYVSDSSTAVCPSCRQSLTASMSYVAPPAVKKAAEDGGGLVKGVVTYMVMDDLVVKPMSTISSITLLNKLNVRDLGVLEEKEVNFGINEALKLLKASQQSKNVLTDVFC
ncbi:hypothetical protein C2S51_013107 [Perilla frutescens var. frutescens]|nr:hypothetical protein C2S51_013107 [Perilla frutescens var. frutescens]